MKVTIHQAYFMPWLGYFSKLTFSDIFVVLDNVDFRKRHYFDRTKIVNMQGEIRWLGLPVGQNFKTKCNQVYINLSDKSYVDRIIRTIELSYAQARFFDAEWPRLRDVLRQPLDSKTNLVDINLDIVKSIMTFLEVEMPKIHLASDLIENCTDPSERIIRICNAVCAKSIVVGGGMSLMVHDWKEITDQGINVYMQNYLEGHPIYKQSRRNRAGFQAGLSIIDAILNVGSKQTLDFLTDKIYSPVFLDATDDVRTS